MNTTSIKYMGSKRKLLDSIIERVYTNASADDTLLDVFTGSTRVAQALRQNKFYTLSSDILPFNQPLANCFLGRTTSDETELQEIIDELNECKPVEGWLAQTYGDADPAKPSRIEGKRVRAFTHENAMKADAIRDRIEEMDSPFKDCLLTSLILALDKVQNSQGHQRAFFTEYQVPGSLKPLQLIVPPFMGDPSYDSRVDGPDDQYPTGKHLHCDVLTKEYKEFVIENTRGNVIAYLDPPYTSFAKYNWFYHLWDSIVMWDKPEVVGATNRRADYAPAGGNLHGSTWTEKGKAYDSFVQLYNQLDFVDTFIISYSDESLINHEEMIEAMKSSGLSRVEETAMIKHQRHALAKSGNASEETKKNAHMKVTEYIFTAHRS